MPKAATFRSWKVVILSFIGATTFWFFSALGKEYNYRIQHPITFRYDADSLVAVKPLPEYIDIDVLGGGWDLFKESFWFGNDPVIFELENPVAIRYLTRASILPILTEQLSEYRINFLFTDTLYIDIDRKSSKKVMLSIDSAKISLDDEYRIVSPISMNPDTAWIFGPTSFLDTLGSLLAIPLSVQQLNKNFEQSVSLGLPDGYDISSNPSTINVKFNLERFETLEIPTLVEMINFPRDSSVYVTNPKVKVQFVVRESMKEEYFSKDFKVIVDYSTINKSNSTAPAIIVVHPEHALEVEVDPDSVSITYVR